MGVDTIFIIVIIIFSVIVHEVMHGVVADMLGDPTARYAGRLTINPIPHLDLVGSIIVPIVSSFAGFFFGWAKPVPVNPYNFRILRSVGEGLVAFAGPLSNLVIALIFGAFIRIGILPDMDSIFALIVIVNCSLFMLNMIPIPPLDGSKVLTALLPGSLQDSYLRFRSVVDQNIMIGFILVVIFVNIFSRPYASLVFSLAHLIAGI